MIIETQYKEPVGVKAGDDLHTRDGQQAHIIAVNPDAELEDQCIVGWVSGRLHTWCIDGMYLPLLANKVDPLDLVLPKSDVEVALVTSCIVIREDGERLLINDVNADQARELVEDAVMIHYIEYPVPAAED